MKIGNLEIDEKTVLYFTISFLIVFALIHLYVINSSSSNTIENFEDVLLTSDQDLGNYKVTINSLDDIIISSKNEKLSDIIDSLDNNIENLVSSNIAILTTTLLQH